MTVQQTTSQGGNTDQPVISSSVLVTGDYTGSVVGGSLPSGVLSLTLGDAVKRGLATNLGGLTAGNDSTLAAAQRLSAFSQLLPQVTASLSGTETQVNLAKAGLGGLTAGGNSGGNGGGNAGGNGFQFPLVVGPFHYFDAQGNVDWTAFSLTSIRNYRSQQKIEQAAKLQAQDARELIVLAVGGSYLQLVTAASRIDSQRAQVSYAQAVYDQAKAQLDAGTNVLVDVTRVLVQLQTEQQRLISLQGDFDQRKLAFCRTIGVPQDQALALTQPLEDASDVVPDDLSRIRNAFGSRRDLLAAQAQVQAAELVIGAARAERLPTVNVSGFYGANGSAFDQAHGVFTATAQLNIPIFNGGKTRASIQQAEVILKQRKAEYEDIRGKVEQDVRNALIQIRSATGQLKLAKSNRTYANQALKQSQDRLAAGVTTTVEVVQAEQQLSGAETDYISSLFSLNLARLYLARATGSAEADLDPLFGMRK